MNRHLVALKIIVSAFTCCLMCVGCNKKETEPPAAVRPATSGNELKVDLPSEVNGTWKTVRVQVLDKSSYLTTECTVPIGGVCELQDPLLRIEAPLFVPDFVMKNGTITTRSNQLNNPAVKIVVYQQGKQIFNSWIYGRYQVADMHKKFRFMLADVQKK